VIRFVLCRPSHPGNIGAAARAIKTMGFSDLRLVAPERYPAPRPNGWRPMRGRSREQVRLTEQSIKDCVA
jgi:tRNA C32,U32 (ribose-2'-O)-methylase TrmJ